MDTYDVTPGSILDWAQQYASYEELEQVAKALYSIYVQERKHNYPEEHKKNRKYYKLRKRGRG